MVLSFLEGLLWLTLNVYHEARGEPEVGQLAVQLHGGMGMTDELAVGDYFKRLVAIDLLWGDAQDQLSTLEGML